MTDQDQPQNWYSGPYNERMEHLIRDGGVPFSIADLLKKRINVQGMNVGIREPWWFNPLNSGDGIVYNYNGNVKIVLDAHPLLEIAPGDIINLGEGGLALQPGVYETLSGVELKPTEFEEYIGSKDLPKEDLQSNLIWVVLTRGGNLLREALDLFYGNRNAKEGSMNIDIDPVPEFPRVGGLSIIKPLSIARVDSGSSLYTGSLTDPAGILVGEFRPDSGIEARV